MRRLLFLIFCDGLEAIDFSNVSEHWRLKVGINCYKGHGVSESDIIDHNVTGPYTIAECQNLCAMLPDCTAVVIKKDNVSSYTAPNCWRQKNILESMCESDDKYDVWQRKPLSPSPVPCELEYCSPEVCNITRENLTVNLEARTYNVNRQIFLPRGTRIIGAGTRRTFVRACGPFMYNWSPAPHGEPVSSCRRGFLLNDDTYVGRLTFVGRERGRWCCHGGPLCGAVETPGMTGSAACTGDNRCNGVSNATVEDFEVAAFTTTTVAYVAATPKGSRISQGLRFNGLYADGTWADGVNIHGGHTNITIENSVVRFTSDDVYAIWSNLSNDRIATNITFRNNTAAFPRSGFPANFKARGDGIGPQPNCTGQQCFAVIGGGGGHKLIGNRCISGGGQLDLFDDSGHHLSIRKSSLVLFHNSLNDTYGGAFSSDAIMTLHGNTVEAGSGQGCNCTTVLSPVCWWMKEQTSTWSKGMLPQVSGSCERQGGDRLNPAFNELMAFYV